jgi:integrating conjugative element protein (TIGR03765 family)
MLGTYFNSCLTVTLLAISLNAYSLQEIPLTLNNQNHSNSGLDLSSPIGVPVKSKVRPGKIKARQLKEDIFNQSLFVIGDDESSKSWLDKHAKELKSLQAIGFITNVINIQSIINLQQQYQLPLLPVNVDPLTKHLNVKHYPFIISKGKLWQ